MSVAKYEFRTRYLWRVCKKELKEKTKRVYIILNIMAKENGLGARMYHDMAKCLNHYSLIIWNKEEKYWEVEEENDTEKSQNILLYFMEELCKTRGSVPLAISNTLYQYPPHLQ